MLAMPREACYFGERVGFIPVTCQPFIAPLNGIEWAYLVSREKHHGKEEGVSGL